MKTEEKKKSINSDLLVRPQGVSEEVWRQFANKRAHEREQIELDEAARVR